jgi:hypothetical protein
MIHPAYMLILAVIEAIAILSAVAFGFRAGYAAYKGDKPPAIALTLPASEEELPLPIGPTAERKAKRLVTVEDK